MNHWTREDIWAATAQGRRELVTLLESLDADEWDAESLCDGWRVRDVIAHLVLGATLTQSESLREMVRYRGNFNRLVHETAIRRTDPVESLVEQLRAVIDSRRHPPATVAFDPLTDILVHTQDVAIPLGRTVPMPTHTARAATTFVWRRGFPFGARHRFRGLHVEATDVPWTRGSGSLVHGPIATILLACSGRPVALESLQGEGVAELRRRMTA
ncbi:maleylpyruvate isomerase family mycothiol-dependent enzyme [Aldersonia kunmingensis]|uniref:maleylpyruvate isomerase family mycothiol-dependent enzyme n=1 Tax=Aldersonia kunmingensis TaxID=408066 RepID=UPI00082EA9F4|nr:maleylpyruvate isomerase family mycothiol-dependent enzyme [Aldersonia kunmingensis]